MLKIYYGEKEDAIYNTSVYFKFNYNPEWFKDPDIIHMVKDIDNSSVLGNGAIDSPVLGVIAPVTLSGGLKTLILIDKVQDRIFNASNCGDNCAGWILKIADNKDIKKQLELVTDFSWLKIERLLTVKEVVESLFRKSESIYLSKNRIERIISSCFKRIDYLIELIK